MILIFTYTSMHYHAILPMCHLMYIVGSGLPPSSYQSWLLCVYQTKLYPPSSSILTVPLTYPNRLILHISRIYYYLCHWESLNRWQGSWYAKYCSCRWLIKLDILYVCISYVSLGWMEDHAPHWPKNVPPRQTYIYIVQRRRWQRHCNRIVMIRCT